MDQMQGVNSEQLLINGVITRKKEPAQSVQNTTNTLIIRFKVAVLIQALISMSFTIHSPIWEADDAILS